MSDCSSTDRGESPALLEPLLPAEEGPHWPGLTLRARRILEASDDLAACLEQRDEAALSALEGEVLRREVMASWSIEGEVASRDDVARMEVAMREMEGHPWPALECLVAAHARLFPSCPGLRRVDVAVGRHVAPSPGAVPRMLGHLETSYGRPGKTSRVLGVAAGHHRFNWCHPFLDGNGRVARLVSRSGFGRALPAARAWSLSEGLALRQEEYLRLLALADEPRRGDRDGRGNLSEARLASFMNFILEVAEKQILQAFRRGADG